MSRARWALLILGVAAVLAGCKAEGLLKKGDAAMRANRHGEAARFYELALEEKPDLAENPDFAERLREAQSRAAYAAGVVLADRGDWDDAVELFEKSLGIDPEFDNARRALGGVRRDGAAALYLAALDHADHGRMAEAVADLRHVLRLDPEHADVQAALASVGETDADGGRAGGLYEEGLAHAKERRWGWAAEAFRSAVAADPNHLPSRAELHRATDNLRQAEAHFESGRRLLGEKRLDEAVGALEQALGVWPYHGEAGRVLAEAKTERGRAERLLTDGSALAEQGRWDEAIAALRSCLDAYPFHQDAKSCLARANQQAAEEHAGTGERLLAEGRLEDAETAFERALAYVPDLARACEGLARADAARGDASAGQGYWGAALLSYLDAADHFDRPPYTTKVREARLRVRERIAFGVSLDVRGARAGRLRSEIEDRVLARKPASLDLVASGATYAATVDVTDFDVRSAIVRTEQRLHPYTVGREIPNPEIPRLMRELASARHDLAWARRHAVCSTCGGSGRIGCTACGGQGWVWCPTCQGNGRVTCAKCGGTGKVAGNPCPRCGGPGTHTCPTCGGRRKTCCPHCSNPSDWRGWRVCPTCAGTGERHKGGKYEVQRLEAEVRDLETALATAPHVVIEETTAEWPYVVEFHEKTGSLDATVRIAELESGQALFTDSVHGAADAQDTTIPNPNPSVGLEGDPLELPSDTQVEASLVDSTAPSIADKIFEAVTRARADAIRAHAERLGGDGRRAESVEARVDLALTLEAQHPDEAKAILAGLRGGSGR